MADLSPLAFTNYGLSQAQQGQASASANLEQQQAAAAAMQNQKSAMMLNLFRNGLAHTLDYTGQNGGQQRTLPDMNDSTDASGVSGAAGAGQGGSPQRTGTDASGAPLPMEDVGASAVDQGRIEAGLEQAYGGVNPEGTQDEIARIQQAYERTADPAIAVVPELKAYAEAQLAAAKGERDMNVKARLKQVQVAASKHYDTLSAVESADPGQALAMLSKTQGGDYAAQRILQAHPGASADELDEVTRDTVAHTAAFMHRFTGRETEYGTDGYLYDKQSGLKVTGAPPRGFSQQQIADMRKEGNEMTTVKINGRDTPVHKYEAAGFDNVDQYVQSGVSQAQSIQRGKNHYTQVATNVVQNRAQVPQPQPGAPQQPQPGAPQPGAPQQPQPGAPQQPQQPQPQQPQRSGVGPQPGAAPARPDPMVSPNASSTGGRLDFSDAPRSPEVNTGRSGPNDTEAAINKGYGTDVIGSASTASQRVAAANSAIQGANNAQIAVKNGALTGPLGTKVAFYQTLLGNPTLFREMWGNPAARQVLEKALKNDAIMGIEKESQGGGAQLRLGQATMKLATEQLAASADMTPEAIMTMTDAVRKNALYDKQKFGSDYATYSRTPGVDRRVDAYSGWYDNKYPNTTTINPVTLNSGTGGLPDARANKGRVVGNGQHRLQSNGTSWVPLAPRGGSTGSF